MFWARESIPSSAIAPQAEYLLHESLPYAPDEEVREQWRGMLNSGTFTLRHTVAPLAMSRPMDDVVVGQSATKSSGASERYKLRRHRAVQRQVERQIVFERCDDAESIRTLTQTVESLFPGVSLFDGTIEPRFEVIPRRQQLTKRKLVCRIQPSKAGQSFFSNCKVCLSWEICPARTEAKQRAHGEFETRAFPKEAVRAAAAGTQFGRVVQSPVLARPVRRRGRFCTD
jgi:hypothetical protein